MFINCSNHSSHNWSKQQKQATQVYSNIIDIPFPNVIPTASEEEIANQAEQQSSMSNSVKIPRTSTTKRITYLQGF